MGIEQAIPLLPRLRRHARLLTGDAARADDLVQDTLERACQKWQLWQPQGDAEASLRAWLFTMMHKLYLNQLRDSRAQHYDPWHEGHEPAHEPATRAATLLDLERGLALLSAPAREVLLLICVEEYSYQEAADILALPIGTVMSRLARAREHLRALMADALPTSACAAAAAGKPDLRVVK